MTPERRLNSTVVVVVVFFFFFSLAGRSWGAFTPADSYYIVCGSPQKVAAHDRDYLPDSDPSIVSLVSSGDGVLSVPTASVPSPIYASLRFFPSPATYRFQIRRPGRHWLRLFFPPAAAAVGSPGDLSSAPITAVAAGVVLLHNSLLPGNQSTFKEFSLPVSGEELALTFLPAAGRLAYISAIELVSAPDDLVPVEAAALPAGAVPISGLSSAALETAFRVNVGGPAVTPDNDTLGRTWVPDGPFLHAPGSAVQVAADPAAIRYPPGGPTAETAPVWVYATADAMGEANVTASNFNMTWIFPGERGFSYLVRLHFCDVVSRALNTLVFNVYLNSALAVPSLDLSSLRGALAVPYYKDFVCNATAAADGGGASEIAVSVGPDPLADLSNAILNGVEIMKMATPAGSLASTVSAADLLHPASSSTRHRRAAIVIAACAAAALALAFLCAAAACLARKRRVRRAAWLPLALHGGGGWSASLTSKASSRRTAGSAGSAAAQRSGRKFTLAEMETATGRWDEAAVLGVGGFGRVYRGTLDDGTQVAVKRGNPRSEQGLAEFQTEIEMLSRLRHRHLVSLIGHCDDRDEMILVYEYMANGPLRSHLYGGGRPALPWRRRLEICIGAARGLHYLHTGAAQSVIHRDVKTTNILLDEQLVAKVADFGLSKAGPALDQTHVSTAVKGSFGYLDPEYFRRQQLTDKSDVYSLGVVLMEVLCARPALDPALPREQVNLAEWAMGWQRLGQLAQIVDPAIAGEVSPASLRKFGETAEKCLAEHAADRPAMGDVLWNLEYALQLQEAAAAVVAGDSGDSSTNHIAGLILDPPLSSSSPPPLTTPEAPEEGATASAVFSQLVNPRGR